MDDRLARAGDTAGAVDQRVIGQALGGNLDRRADAVGGGRVVIAMYPVISCRSCRASGRQISGTVTVA